MVGEDVEEVRVREDVRVVVRSEVDMLVMLVVLVGGCMMKDCCIGWEEEEERSEEDGMIGDGLGEVVIVGKLKDVFEVGEGVL